MAMLAWILAILGALCAVMGFVTAAEVIPELGSAYTVTFWLQVSMVLFLATIAAALGRSGNRYE